MKEHLEKIGKAVDGGKVIVDVICRCGHSIKDHQPVVCEGDALKASPDGHGQCSQCGCDTFRFRRNRYKKGK